MSDKTASPRNSSRSLCFRSVSRRSFTYDLCVRASVKKVEFVNRYFKKAGGESAEEAGVIVAWVLGVQSLEDQTRIHSPESERVGQCHLNGSRPCFIGDIVQITGGIRVVEINRGREHPVEK